MAAIVVENRTQRRLSQKSLSLLSGIPYGSIRNMERADVDFKIPDVVAIAAALSTTALPGGSAEPVQITPSELVRQAVERAGGFATFVSEASSTTDDLSTRRLQKEAEQMSTAEIEEIAEAANRDEQMRTDEPPTV